METAGCDKSGILISFIPNEQIGIKNQKDNRSKWVYTKLSALSKLNFEKPYVILQFQYCRNKPW